MYQAIDQHDGEKGVGKMEIWAYFQGLMARKCNCLKNDIPNSGIELSSLPLQEDFYHLSHQGSPKSDNLEKLGSSSPPNAL